MKTLSALTIAALILGASSSTAGAATVLFDFAPSNGLFFGVGGNAPIVNNGIKMTVLSGTYEVTFASELNLKDFSGTGTPRTVQFGFVNGQKFDFLGLALHDGFGTITLTSSAGGSISTSDLITPLSVSGVQWQNVDWVQATISGSSTTAKIASFSFNDVPTVPEPASLLLSSAGLAASVLRRRRD